MARNEYTVMENKTGFFKAVRNKDELDESTFDLWKVELQKELPTFWEEMNH